MLSHVIDRDDGGRPAFDITALGLAAALTVVALEQGAGGDGAEGGADDRLPPA